MGSNPGYPLKKFLLYSSKNFTKHYFHYKRTLKQNSYFVFQADDHLLRFAKRAGDDHLLRFARAGDDHFLRFAKSWPLIRGARDQTNGHMLRFSKRSVPEDQMEEQTDDQSRFHGPSLDR